jgi:AbrB family looped-hinge helix DNA binding protein
MKLKSKVTKGGKLSIPSKFRKNLNIKDGTDVIFSIENGEMKITPVNLVLERARSILKKHVNNDVSLVDELIRERRKEAEDE